MVHRVDGPISAYRGWDNGTDQRIWQINHELADATIFQSHYSLQKHLELGLEMRNPCVIMNAVDGDIFHPHGHIAFERQRKIRLVSTSWSDNPNKGAATYQWIEDHLDWERFDYTFVGRSPIRFQRIHMREPLSSTELAAVLRQHDIFITASVNDPCSNSLIEALACGLPVLYLHSGGHPEIVGQAGLGFSSAEEIPTLLDQLVDEYEQRQAQINLPTMEEVAERYLKVMGLHNDSTEHDDA
jgi:glycosyltransferase involved in cell wall biosynthesis